MDIRRLHVRIRKMTRSEKIAYSIFIVLAIALIVVIAIMFSNWTPFGLIWGVVMSTLILGSLYMAVCRRDVVRRWIEGSRARLQHRGQQKQQNESSLRPTKEEKPPAYSPSIDDTQQLPVTTYKGTDRTAKSKRLQYHGEQSTANDKRPNSSAQGLPIGYMDPQPDDDTLYEAKHDSSMDNTPRYQERFSVVALILTILPACLACLLAVIGAIFATSYINTSSNLVAWIWLMTAVVVILALIFCYFAALIWSNKEFVIGPDGSFTFMQPMPAPLSDKSKTINARQTETHSLQRNWIDKLCGTCRLSGDTQSDEDEEFKSIKWLKYPDKVREAVGVVPRKKTSWIFWRS